MDGTMSSRNIRGKDYDKTTYYYITSIISRKTCMDTHVHIPGHVTYARHSMVNRVPIQYARAISHCNRSGTNSSCH
ncbi:unnamed protein product [Onchocerca flexuosa]|uniref:Ovule protein n=1 Tax=Onchocerca flexuosa TaxID=387005 RepID=A0A183I6V7_9BILA|nr:unnamed protein product [Onchocerca flexuosa]